MICVASKVLAEVLPNTGECKNTLLKTCTNTALNISILKTIENPYYWTMLPTFYKPLHVSAESPHERIKKKTYVEINLTILGPGFSIPNLRIWCWESFFA